jgi:hypothetical protein
MRAGGVAPQFGRIRQRETAEATLATAVGAEGAS